ncbi:unnamed protein product [Ilex paraguariensis]|uniref:Uncharacterized protein n=1 Tax=Ilex paraguariensis TaxID=185542 RepID=A0ABC8UBL0_9AQUA
MTLFNMGNCLVLQDKVITVMKTDGKILEYKAPMKVHQVMSEFTGHAISDTLPVVRHLPPDADMLGSHTYYLPPLPAPPEKFNKKMIRFSNALIEAGQETRVVRIKLVISKQELEMMLRKGGASADGMVSQLRQKHSANGLLKSEGDSQGCKGWKPVLESIPEAN